MHVIFDALVAAFEKDRATITAQARMTALAPDAPMLPLHCDAALVRFCKLVAETVGGRRGG